MGYSISGLACRGLTAQAACQRLGLTEASRTAEYACAKFTAHELPGGWHLIVADRCDHTMIGAPSLTVLYAGCEVVACSNLRPRAESGGTGAADERGVGQAAIRQGAGAATTRACHPAS